MRLVDRQVLRELIGPFIFGFAAFTSVFFSASVLIKVSEWLMNGMSIWTALEISLLSLPSIIFWTLPMSTLLAVLMAMSRLSGESEIVALCAGGVSLYRIAMPILWMGILISGSAVVLNEFVAPIANDRVANLQAAVFKQASVGDHPFTLEDSGTNSRIIVQGGMNKEKGILRDVTILQFSILPRHQNRPALLVYASRAEWAGLKDPSKLYRWKLYDGYSMVIAPGNPQVTGASTWSRTQTKEVEIRKTPKDMALFQNMKPEQMSFSELSRMVKILKRYPDRTIDQIRQLEVDRWNKLAVPISSLIFALLATPLGIRPHRSSSSVGLGLSILVIFFYWIVARYTWSLSVQGNLTPMMGAFAPNIIGLIAAFVLLKRATK